MALLRGGAAAGSYSLFGDLDQQFLELRRSPAEALAEIERQAPLTRWHLTENCRNFKAVGQGAVRLAGLPASVYSGYLRSGGSPSDLTFRAYDDAHDQVVQLRGLIQDALGRGYKPRDITILSFCSAERSAAAQLAGLGVQQAAVSPRGIGYCSVDAFKGMESPVVIVTDVDLGLGRRSRALFYTALTRSTGWAAVVCRERDAQQLIEWSQGASA
jgi:hypothetical protein